MGMKEGSGGFGLLVLIKSAALQIDGYDDAVKNEYITENII